MAKEKKALDLVDISVDEKDWRQIRKTASQEELMFMALGAKYRIGTYSGKAFLYAIGLILSLGIGLPLFLFAGVDAGLVIAIVGYIAFAFLSTKYGRYSYTFDQVRKKLSKEYRRALDEEMKEYEPNFFLNFFLTLALLYLTLPFQAIMLMISMVAPKFYAAKNGVLITVPRGCELDNIIASYGYYESENLLAAAEFLLKDCEETSYEKWHKYEIEIKNEYGTKVKLHSADNITFYDDNNNSYKYDAATKKVYRQ